MRADEPRIHRAGFGWPVDLARDRQSNCSRCRAPIYFVKVKRKDGKVRWHPLSEALASRDGDQVYLGSHFANCPSAGKFQKFW